MKRLLGMMPGAGKIREQPDQFDECEVDRIEAIMRSMTLAERQDLKLLNGSRRARVAADFGTMVADVNGLVQRFETAQKMMGGMAGMAGVGGEDSMGITPGFERTPGMGKYSKAKQQAKSGKKSKAQRKAESGNPTRAARQAREALQRRGAGGAVLPPALEAGAPGVGGLSDLGGGLGGDADAAMDAGAPGKSADGQPVLTVDGLPDDIKRMLSGMWAHLGVCWGMFRRHWGVSGS